MKLTCPNCAAQYEVDAALIPDEGRDVQCSNCSHVWFELPPAPGEDIAPTPAVAAPAARPTAPEPSPAPEPRPEPPADERARYLDDDDPDEFDPPKPRPAPPPRDVDPKAMSIIREEAARELAERRAESAALETQAEFDVGSGGSSDEQSRALRARMARLRGESRPEPERSRPPEDADDYSAPRRELLPDIDEINSSLRPADSDAAAAEIAERRAFRRGFGAMVVVAFALVVLYLAAPAIARNLPGTAPALAAYVDTANGFRAFVDGILR